MRPPNNMPVLKKNKNSNTVLEQRPVFESFQPEVNANIKASMFDHKINDTLLNKSLGINVNPQLMSLPCITIAQRNGLVVMGSGVPFDRSDYNNTPISWRNKLAFTPDRFGTTADFSQKDHLAINSYVR